PWIDVSAEVAAARPKIAMIMNQHDKARRGECLSETLKPLLLDPRKAVSHADCGPNPLPFRQEQPGAEFNFPFCGNPHIKVAHDGRYSGCLYDERALPQSLTEGKVLPRAFEEPDHEVIGRYACTRDDPRVQLLEQSEAGFLRPADDERDFKQDEVVRVLHSDKRGRVQEAVAGKLVDDLEEVVGGNLENAHQRILDRLRRVAEAGLIVLPFEDMNLYDWHLQFSWFDVYCRYLSAH